ncbi:glutamine amidotransferase [bacterium]|nr:glutamine amidotransferase [bacterium]
MMIDPILHLVFVIAVAMALGIFSVWTYPRGTPGRAILLSLRLLCILVVTFVMLRPSLVFQSADSTSSTLVFLVDQSRSMLLADEAASRSRWDAITKDIRDSQDQRDSLADRFNIRWLTFGSAVTEKPLDDILQAKPDQERTALGEALEEGLRQAARSRVAGVVVLSDGANTAGLSPLQVARQFRSARVPIHAVGYGQEVGTSQSKDLIARAIRSNPTVFAKNKLAVGGEFDVTGIGTSPVNVRLLFNGAEQSRGEFKGAEGADRLLTDLVGTPMAAGDLKITLEANSPGDPQTANNSISTWVTVLSGGISVLEIEGKYRFWEPKYVRWALDQSPDIALEQLFLLEQNGNRGFPDELLEPGRVDVFILGDIAARQFTADQLKKLVERVQSQGAGLMMMGGYESFGPGGWHNSKVAEILPVVMRPTDIQQTGSQLMMPTETGLRHFILRLGSDADANQKAWSSLPPLDGASSWSSLKAGAQLLAQSPEKTPLLAAQGVGAGRTIAFAGDTTWRWRKDKERASYHARFWRQLILWLAKKEDAGSPTLKVSLASRRVPVGQGLPIVVQPIAPDGASISQAELKARVTTSTGGTIPVTLYPQGNEYVGTIRDLKEPGDFTLEVEGKTPSTDLGKSSVKFLAYAEDAESQQTAADHGLLRSISEMTGGSFFRHLDLDKLLRQIAQEDLPAPESKQNATPLWDRWPVLAIFVALATLEWSLRKRWGLV